MDEVVALSLVFVVEAANRSAKRRDFLFRLN